MATTDKQHRQWNPHMYPDSTSAKPKATVKDTVKAAPKTAPKVAVVPAKTTGMGQGFAEAAAKGGGIQPGAHPEYLKDVPIAGADLIKKAASKLMPYYESAKTSIEKALKKGRK